MSRELNGALFGEEINQSAALPSQRMSSSDVASKVEASQKNQLINELVVEVRQLKRKVHELDNKCKVSENRLSTLAQASKTHMERANGACHRLDQALKTSVQELTTKYSTIAGKFTEARVSDTKVQALVDRHNTVVQSFELRITQMQKLIAEQEMKILNYHSALEEMRMEFARLRQQQR